MIDAPLGRVPVSNRRVGRTVDLFDAFAVADPSDIRMLHSGILGHLTEEILAVDQLQLPSSQGSESEAQSLEFLLLSVSDGLYGVCLA